MYTLHKVDTLEKKNRGKNVNNDDFSVSPSPVLWEHQKNSNNEYSVWLSLLLVKTNNNFFRRIAPFEPERRRSKMTEWQIIFLQILSDWVIHLQYRAWVEMWWYDFSSDTVKTDDSPTVHESTFLSDSSLMIYYVGDILETDHYWTLILKFWGFLFRSILRHLQFILPDIRWNSLNSEIITHQ